jgi:DNA-binding response OmpR family regulator
LRVPHVLIVDDDLLVSSVRRLLQPGFVIVGRSRAAEALALLALEDDFDALVLDVDDAADRDVYGALLLDASHARRMIFLTSATDPRAEEFLSSSGRPWLAKPFAAKDLEDGIRRIVSDSERRTG